ncbi:Ankyrin repeat domain-containing protein 40, partial [Stegodyphus mimosarum]
MCNVEMNGDKRSEELLREASAYGDEDSVRSLVENGTDVNAQHNVNGWTALHWAAKRGHSSLVHYLLSRGADPTLTSVYGETAFSLAKKDDIRQILSLDNDESSEFQSSPLPITPNYLANPPLVEKVIMQNSHNLEDTYTSSNTSNRCLKRDCDEEIVLKVRTSDPPNQDFIEIEIPLKNLSYENVFRTCCEELNVLPNNVQKLRKLPNTIVRKDKDVMRFCNFQELELVLNSSATIIKSPCLSKSPAQPEINGTTNNNSSTSNTFIEKSNYCKNGTILY